MCTWFFKRTQVKWVNTYFFPLLFLKWRGTLYFIEVIYKYAMLYFNYRFIAIMLCFTSIVDLPLLIHCVYGYLYFALKCWLFTLDENGVKNFFYSHSSTKLSLHSSTLIYTLQSISIYTCKVYISARPLKCASGYDMNPVTSTCIRLETSKYNWEDAKAGCEAQGDYLAVFTTTGSLAWIRDYIENKAPAGIHYETTYPLHHLL